MGIPWISVQKRCGDLSGLIKEEILYIDTNKSKAASKVFILEYAGKRILFTGDRILKVFCKG